jgi:hypothetical protein
VIRFAVSCEDLFARIDATKPTWRARAARRTESFRARGEYAEPPGPFWSEIKDVYRELQHYKCAYCERKMGGQRRGSIDFDVEHFRPKRGVEVWPTPAILASRPEGYGFATGGDLPSGYYLLAYHPLNYAAGCKICNTILKRSHFPVGAARMPSGDDPSRMTDELSYLVYPIGDIDEDPETIVRFDGPLPMPVSDDAASRACRRARVTIDLFELDIREELLRERCEVIVSLAFCARAIEGPDERSRRLASYAVARATMAGSPHRNCARCYLGLLHTDRTKADAIADAASVYLDTLA